MTKPFLLIMFFAMAASGSAALEEPFTLEIGESMSLESEELELHFMGVTRDSRCPRDVACIVAGEAEAVVRAERGAESAELVFKVPPGGNDRQSFGRYSIAIIALEPQTQDSREIETSEFAATLVVTAAE